VVGAVFARQSFCRFFVGVSIAATLIGTASTQTAGDRESQYNALLQEISNKKTEIAYQESKLKWQEAEMASLRSQIDAVPELKKTIPPMLQAMSAEIDKQISSDVPFKLEERFRRLAAFQEAIADGSGATIGEQMRRALNIYGIEVGYGSNVEAYAGNNPVEDRAGARYAACEADIQASSCGLNSDQFKLLNGGAALEVLKPELADGDFLRYGRLSLVYMQHDGTEGYRYDPREKNWQGLSGNSLLEIRRAVKMAKGEIAPAVVNAPVYVE